MNSTPLLLIYLLSLLAQKAFYLEVISDLDAKEEG